jgi:3-methyladenine DNA glycosylase AlkD
VVFVTHSDIISALAAQANPAKAQLSGRFFKTGPGQYGEGDRFIGLSVPTIRTIAKQFTRLPLSEIELLLRSPIHEHRLTALVILVDQYRRGDAPTQAKIYDLYLASTQWINNWDLVDSSAEYIVGPQLDGRSDGAAVLKRLAHSDSLWERRIAMLACFHYIKQGRSAEAFTVISYLLHDSRDLIQKAVGWMLREIGKRCGEDILRGWLVQNDHYRTMPRTALRYAIERFAPEERQAYLKGHK